MSGSPKALFASFSRATRKVIVGAATAVLAALRGVTELLSVYIEENQPEDRIHDDPANLDRSCETQKLTFAVNAVAQTWDHHVTGSERAKAIKFVQGVADLHKKLSKSASKAGALISDISPIGIDDIIVLVERLLRKQCDLKVKGVCSRIDLGYHYTKLECMENIRLHGLLTQKERTERKIHSRINGSQYGDGVYTCDNPILHRNQSYGPVCLVVARLQGEPSETVSADATYVQHPIVVLRDSAQCAPILQFTSEPDEFLLSYYVKLQLLIDELLNDGHVGPFADHACKSVDAPLTGSPPSDEIPAVIISAVSHDASCCSHSIVNKTVHYIAPVMLSSVAREKIFTVKSDAPSVATSCAICLDSLEPDYATQIERCGHQFHRVCILDAIYQRPRCPICNIYIAVPQGKMPSGTMAITLDSQIRCAGYTGHTDQRGAIEIHYTMPAGIQKAYHP